MEEDILLEEYKIIYGLDKITLLELDDKLVSFCVNLVDSNIGDYLFIPKSSTKERELGVGKSFLESKFKIYDVSYMKEEWINKLNNMIISSIDELIKIYNSLGRVVSPFEIPISYIDESPFYGGVLQVLNICNEKEFLEKMKLYIREISLSKKITNVTGLSYVHEIVHTQVNREKGMILDYNNIEVLSILLELIYAFEVGGEFFLKQLEIRRCNYLLVEFDRLFKYYYENNGISKIEALISSKYINSIIRALRLFIIYYESSLEIKNEMIREIQKIFNFDITLEDMLNKYGILVDSSDNHLILKHMLRK